MSCSTQNVTRCYSGAGTWSREARRVTLLAGELGVALDDETLIRYDVRELMAMRLRLQRALDRAARPSRLPLFWS